MAGPMIELACQRGRMSSINRAGARESHLPNAQGPYPSHREGPRHMMPRAAQPLVRIPVAIWCDDDFTALSMNAQRMFLFLLTRRELSLAGTLPLRERRWARYAANLTVAQVDLDL